MAKAKRLKYEDMNAEQRARAKRCSEKYGIPIEDVPMTVTGLIVLSKADDIVTQRKREMVAKGWADSVGEITQSMYDEYVEILNEETEAIRLR